MTLVSTTTLTGTASGVTFDNLPQTGKDLLFVASIRHSSTSNSTELRLNGSGTTFTRRALRGTGAATSSTGAAEPTLADTANDGNNSTANTFSSVQIYVANYAAATNKSISVDTVVENNQVSTQIGQRIVALSWATANAITTFRIQAETFTLGAQSTFSLYIIS
jgi:hypothetical protein